MKTIPSLLIPVSLVAAIAAAVPFLTSAAPGATVPAADGDLDEPMQNLQAGVKALEKALDKKEVEKALTALREMQSAAHEAKVLEPPKTKEIADPKEQAAMLKGFRLKIIDLERGLLDVEAALVEGKPEDAKKALEARVKPVKKEGHDKYKD